MKRFIPGRDAMDKGRFEAFTDGVFAIAITLLVDRTTNLLNLLLLAVVCLIPYPTALVARYGPLPSSTAFYGATFTAMGIAYGAVWIYTRLRQSQIDPSAPRLTLATAFAGSAGTLIYGVGALIALVAPRLALALFVCVTLYYLVPGLFNPWRELALPREAE